MKSNRFKFLSLTLFVFAIFQFQAASQGNYKAPKNVIIMIADGWSESSIDAAEYFNNGEKGTSVYRDFDIKLFMSTYPAKISDKDIPQNWSVGYNSYLTWSDFEHPKNGATGSGAAGTALATGVKTYNGAIGMDLSKNPLPNMTEKFKSIGRSAGVITSVYFSHATPATFVAHNVHRDNYSEIALSMLLDSRVDVIMGAGHPYYAKSGMKAKESDYNYKLVGGKDAWNDLKAGKTTFTTSSLSGNSSVQDIDGDGKADEWTLIESREQFQKLMSGETPKRVVGVPKVLETLQLNRTEENYTKAFEIPLNNDVPTLVEMTKAAINVLDNNEKGFFLMIEGGAVDWANHANNPPRMIEEMTDFNLSVKAVVDWVESNSSWDETLVIVTGDHDCGYITGPIENNNNPNTNPIINNGKGNMPGLRYNHTNHTNILIPFFAKGAGSDMYNRLANNSDMIRGRYIDLTDVPNAIFMLLEVGK
ncbi:MAG: alkaline phosphatase [Ignavibacteriae bacterium HGW-Ignavibacteriae-1]|nr:MAG: alkaline phosphatase [Ignavibacteriae bacterium HGW-Ignavibacteriae-1]